MHVNGGFWPESMTGMMSNGGVCMQTLRCLINIMIEVSERFRLSHTFF